MSTQTLKKLRIFAASPSDVANERAKIDTVVDLLKPLAESVGLTLEVMNWGKVVPDAGRPEQVILDQLKPTDWDLFIGILWHRFGTPPGGTNPQTKKEFQSGTEEEFVTAYNIWRTHKHPRIMIYRCTRAVKLEALDPDQFKRMKDFFKQVEDVKGDYPLLYQTFDSTEAFEKILLSNLQQILLDYNKQIHGKPISPEVLEAFAPTIANNLPPRSAFFGRAKEMDAAMRALSPTDRTWGILVDGIGGIGKTALAVEAAYRAREAGSFRAFIFVTAKQNTLEPNGIREIAPAAHTLDDFLNETACVLGQPGIPKLSSNEKRHVMLDTLRTMQALLIYDNLETLSKEEQEAMADFLRGLPQGSKAIITSRRRGGEGAVWLRVEKLDWEAARGIIENEMARDGVLANKLSRVESRWQELYDETNGSPLSLMHTLGLLRVRATQTFDNALEMLRGNRDADLQTFIFQEARKELTPNDKVALGALSFFVPSATFDAWMQVASLSRNAMETTIDRLSALSLVDVLGGEERYALHPLTRAFVRDELLNDMTISHETGMQFARYWVDYAKRYGYQHYHHEHLRVELPNLEAASNWLWEKATKNMGANVENSSESISDKKAAYMLNDIATALRDFLESKGHWDEWLEFNKRSYKVMYSMQEWLIAGWRAHDAVSIFLDRAFTDEAKQWAILCIQSWKNVTDKRENAISARMRGHLAKWNKNYHESERLYKIALGMWKEIGEQSSVATVLIDLADVSHQKNDEKAARRYYEEAWKLIQKSENRGLLVKFMCNLGRFALDHIWLTEAHKKFEQAYSLAKEIGAIASIAEASYGLARTYKAEGQTDQAMLLAQEALKIYERLQHRDLAEVWEFVERLANS